MSGREHLALLIGAIMGLTIGAAGATVTIKAQSLTGTIAAACAPLFTTEGLTK